MKKITFLLSTLFIFLINSEYLQAQVTPSPTTMEHGSSVVILASGTNPTVDQAFDTDLNGFDLSMSTSNNRIIAFATSGNGAGTNATGGASDAALFFGGDSLGTTNSCTLSTDSGNEVGITGFDFAYEFNSGSSVVTFTITGKRDGATVGTKTVTGAHATLIAVDLTTSITGSFSSIDQLEIVPSAPMVGGWSMDSIVVVAATTPNTAPTASSFTASSGPYQNLDYTFSTSDFGYSDGDGDVLDHLLIEALPAAGTLWVDLNSNGTLDGGEGLSVSSQVSKTDLDAGRLRYTQFGSTSTSFQFEVNDGTDNSTGNYIATLNVIPVPTVTLGVSPSSRSESTTTANVVTATLSNAYGINTTVNLSFSGTATGSGVDYSLSGTSITITAGSTTGSVNITNVPDALYEGNETVIVDISSVTNGTESGTQQVTYTITDDDPLPNATLEVLPIYNPITDESGGQAYVRGKIDAVAGTTISIPLSFSGTATGGGTDYSITGSTITLFPGQMMDSIRITSQFDGIEEGNETVIVDMETPTNAVESGTQQVTVTINDEDATFPSTTITTGASNPTNSSPFSVTITFSESVTGFALGNITVGNGSASNFAGSGTSYTADITPSGNGAVTVDVAGGVAQDVFGNDNTAATQLSLTYDGTAPSISSVSLAADNSYIDVTFSEGVFDTGSGSGALETGDFSLSISGGSATSPIVTSVTTTGGGALSGGETTVRVNFSVTGTANGSETLEVDLGSSAVFDAVGNAAAANQTSNNIVGLYDDQAPFISSVSLAADNSYIDVTFNEGVRSAPFLAIPLTTSNFALSISGGSATSPTVTSVTDTSGGALIGFETTIRVNFTVTGTPNGSETLEVDLAASVYDADANLATNDQTSNNTATFSDVYAPQILEVGVVEASGTYGVGQTLQVFVQYDEAVTVLGTPQITLETGTTDQVIDYDSTSSSTVYFNYTVQAGDESLDLDVFDANSLNLNGGSIRDAAGNDAAIVLPVGPSTGGSISNGKDIVIDGVAPSGYTVSIDQSPINATNANFVSITITGLSLGDTYNYTFTSSGGAGSVTNSGVVGTLPDNTAGIDLTSLPDGTITISLTLTDPAGNTGAAVTDTETKITSIGFSVNDPSIAEGNSGSTTLTFTVSLDNPAPAGGATVDYEVTGGTASDIDDFTAIPTTTLSFAVGETSKTVDVTVSGDETVEVDETVTINLSNPTGTGVIISDASGTGTITNDDATTVSIADVTANENAGPQTMTATLSNPVQGGFTLEVYTIDNSATAADNDYTPFTAITLTFAGTAGETQTFTIEATADTKVEADELAAVGMRNLGATSFTTSEISIGSLARFDIINDDTATVTIDDVTVNENDGTATATLTVDNAVQGGFSVDVSTADGTATTAASDYTPVIAQTETFTGIAGETKLVNITIGDDMIGELTETFSVSMGNLVATVASPSDIDVSDGATITILDDDAPMVTSVAVPTDGNYGLGQDLDFVVTFSNAVTITGTPFLSLTVGSTTVQADLVGTVTSATTATFRYTVATGDLDADGVALGSTINLNGGSIQDGVGTDAILDLNGVASTANVNADGIIPTVVINTTASSPTNTTFTATFTFSEPVMNWDLTDINVTNGTASIFNQNSPTQFTALITPTANGDVTVNVLAGTVQDLAGNDIEDSNTIEITYDTINPTVEDRKSVV